MNEEDKRQDYFAARAMVAMMREKIAHSSEHAYDTIAEMAYKMADAMIERERATRATRN